MWIKLCFVQTGPATKTSELLQLRALDWDTTGPFQAYPVVMVRPVSKNPLATKNLLEVALCFLLAAADTINDSSHGYCYEN